MFLFSLNFGTSTNYFNNFEFRIELSKNQKINRKKMAENYSNGKQQGEYFFLLTFNALKLNTIYFHCNCNWNPYDARNLFRKKSLATHATDFYLFFYQQKWYNSGSSFYSCLLFFSRQKPLTNVSKIKIFKGNSFWLIRNVYTESLKCFREKSSNATTLRAPTYWLLCFE